jgi:hypothetical protein
MTCYAGTTKDGRMILTPQFEASLRRHYAANGWPLRSPIAAGPAFAMDSAPADATRPNDDNDERYAALEQAYARAHRNPIGLSQGELSLFEHREMLDDLAGAAAETTARGDREMRVQTDSEYLLAIARFKRARGMDSWPAADVRRLYDLEAAYQRIRLSRQDFVDRRSEK